MREAKKNTKFSEECPFLPPQFIKMAFGFSFCRSWEIRIIFLLRAKRLQASGKKQKKKGRLLSAGKAVQNPRDNQYTKNDYYTWPKLKICRQQPRQLGKLPKYYYYANEQTYNYAAMWQTKAFIFCTPFPSTSSSFGARYMKRRSTFTTYLGIILVLESTASRRLHRSLIRIRNRREISKI